MVGQFKPDAIVLYLGFSGNAAIKLLKMLRSASVTKAVPVIGFVRDKRIDLITDASSAGANYCLVVDSSTGDELVQAVYGFFPRTAPASSPAKKRSPSSPKPIKPQAKLKPDSPPIEKPVTAPTPKPKDQPGETRKNSPESELASLTKLKTLSQQLLKTNDKEERLQMLQDLFKVSKNLTQAGTEARAPHIDRMYGGMVALFESLSNKPKYLSSSNLRTINQSVDFALSLIQEPRARSKADDFKFSVLAVDDEQLAAIAVKNALRLINLTPDSILDPLDALELARSKTYDLFIFDLMMPGMDGWGLCNKIRDLARYRETPVIFVTSSDGFENRMKFARSGGTDLIAKPFLQAELGVKVLINLIHHS